MESAMDIWPRTPAELMVRTLIREARSYLLKAYAPSLTQLQRVSMMSCHDAAVISSLKWLLKWCPPEPVAK